MRRFPDSYIRYFFSTFVIALCCIATAFAQMTDDQVISMAKDRMQSGADRKQVAAELLSKGATREQLQKLYSNYTQQSAGSNTEAESIGSTGSAVLRESNGGIRLDFDYTDGYASNSNNIQSNVYGRNIFRNKALSFEPSMNIATPAEYVLGPGDELVVDIYGSSQQSTRHVISPDGSITLDKVGPINVSGLTVQQANARIYAAIGGYYEDSKVRTTVGQTRTIVVNVFGEVASPGTYKLSAFATAFNALYLAGGTSEIGTLRNIRVLRNGRVISTIDVYDYLQHGNLTGNVMLKDNDVIMVDSYANIVTIQGKVKRPMKYELKSNETVADLLALAGGHTGDAYKDEIRIERRSDEGLTVHTVPAAQYKEFRLADADIIVVGDIIERYQNMTEVQGAVFRPGRYTLGTQVYSVKTLVQQAGGLLERAFTSRAILKRMQADRTYKDIAIDIAGILEGRIADVMLENEDHLYIGSIDQLLSEQTVEILGEVYNPGKYAYSYNTTIEDLITEAGGLQKSASLENVEIARRITSGADQDNPNQIARIYQYTLSDGLAIGESQPFVLEPYDVVTIHPNPLYFTQARVSINGEVLYKGSYVLAEKGETISELIKRAGGLTAKAYPAGARLIRRMNQDERTRRQELVNLAEKDSLVDIDLTSVYTVGIDLEEAIAHPGSMADIVLQEGDQLNIPQINNTVKINGEVLYPNTVVFEEGKKYKHYINQGGGFTKQARKRFAYVVYANGKVSKARGAKIKPGCEIVVPTKPEKTEIAQNASLWVSMTSTLATVAAVLLTALK